MGLGSFGFVWFVSVSLAVVGFILVHSGGPRGRWVHSGSFQGNWVHSLSF